MNSASPNDSENIYGILFGYVRLYSSHYECLCHTHTDTDQFLYIYANFVVKQRASKFLQDAYHRCCEQLW